MDAAIKPVHLAALALVAGAALFVILRAPKQTGQALGGAAVDLVGGIMSGAVVGIGEAVGVPETAPDRCAAAKAAGDTWEASFACPAGDFVSWWWGK